METLSRTTAPPALRALLDELRREIREQCPDLAVRVTYAPAQNIDAFIEVYADTGGTPPAVPGDSTAMPAACQLAEARFVVADAETYTVAVWMHNTGDDRR